VSLQEVSRALASAYGLNQPRGALIADILPGSPAAKSDLRTGDIVLAYEGRAIDRSTDLPPQVGLTMPGTYARLNVFRRDGGARNVVVTVGELKEEIAAKPMPRRDNVAKHSRYGLALSEMPASQRKNLGIDNGISVVSVEDGQARDAGLRPGDVILEVDGKHVSDVATFHRLLEHTPPRRPVVLRVRRGMSTLFLAIIAAEST
jgi:serine protease Do